MLEIEQNRMSAGVDPHLHVWGAEISIYLFLGGLCAGLMILTALFTLRGVAGARSRAVRWSLLLAPLLLSLGMFALMLDLSYKPHLFRFYTAFRPASPMSWGAWILVVIYPVTILLGLAELTDAERARLNGFWPFRLFRLAGLVERLAALGRRRLEPLRWASLILGVGLGIYTGILLSNLGVARPAWGSAVLGPLFLASGFSTGAALLMLLPVSAEEQEHLVVWDLSAIGLELALLALYLVTLAGAGGQAGREAAKLFLGGPHTALFWGLVVVTGLVIPLFCEAHEFRHGLKPSVMAPVLLLAGGFALRAVLVSAGQA